MNPREGPLIGILCSVPPLREALARELRTVGRILVLDDSHRNPDSTLRSLRLGAVVVDRDEVAHALSIYGYEASVPVVQVTLRGTVTRILDRGLWVDQRRRDIPATAFLARLRRTSEPQQ